jgi:hypothetical protein
LQATVYSRVLDRVTLVVGERHLTEAKKLVPTWWGVQLVGLGQRGKLRLSHYRTAQPNPRISAFHLAHLLWRSELLIALSRYTSDKGLLKLNRIGLCKALADAAPLSALRAEVRERLKNRTGWRRPGLPSSHGD